MRGSVGVPRVPEAKGGLSRCRAGGTGQGAGGRGCIWSTGLWALELRGFPAAAGSSTFTEGITPWKSGRPGPTAPSSANATFPGLSPGWRLGELFPEASPRPPPSSVSHFLFPLLFFPFYPKVIRENFFCRLNAGKARLVQPYVGTQPPCPPGRGVGGSCSQCSLGALVLCQQALLLLQTLGLTFLSRNQFPLLVYKVPQDKMRRPKMEAPLTVSSLLGGLLAKK